MAALAEAGRALSDAMVLFHSRASESVGLGATDWKALGLIAQGGPMTHGELREKLKLKPASVTNILDRLEAGGWIERRRSPHDGRSVVVTVNEARVGEMRKRVFGPLMQRMNHVYAQYDTAELNLLADAFSRIAKAQQAALEDLKAREEGS
jgi:DNA-binding MarR family transcriptional regulator